VSSTRWGTTEVKPSSSGAMNPCSIVPDNTTLMSSPTPFEAVTVNEYGPATVGVPVIAPVSASSDRPAGSSPAVTEYEAAG